MSATIWSILPPVIAIVLALITKEVYMSLLIGIFAGAILFEPGIIKPINNTFQIMGDKIGGNADILIFLVLLGILVALITKSGASKAYGQWASQSIKSKKGSLLATAALGVVARYGHQLCSSLPFGIGGGYGGGQPSRSWRAWFTDECRRHSRSAD